MTNSSSAIEQEQRGARAADRRRRAVAAADVIGERAFGFAWPDCARAAASLSRIT